MKLHPLVFVILAYGIAAVISVLVTLIVKVIALAVQRKKGAADAGAKPES